MKHYLVCIFLLTYILGLASYQTGTYNKTFIDPSRNNRQIPTTIYYPIDNANPLNVYPYIVFGHGFNGSCESYGVLTSNVINLGWIIVYPRTEEVFSFNSTDLARDMSFLHDAFYNENISQLSPLCSRIDTLAVIAGYSMGGACAVVAAYQEPDYHSLVTMAAAAYLYSACTTYASSVMMPSVTFSGSADVVAAPSNQQNIYNNLASDYKSFISFTGQGHTNFYNNSLIYTLLSPWLDYLKTGSIYYVDQYEALLTGYPPSTLTYLISDNLVVYLTAPQNIVIFGSSSNVTVSWDRIMEATGYRVYASDIPNGGFSEVTSQGIFSGVDRISWTCSTSGLARQFYYIKAFRQ